MLPSTTLLTLLIVFVSCWWKGAPLSCDVTQGGEGSEDRSRGTAYIARLSHPVNATHIPTTYHIEVASTPEVEIWKPNCSSRKQSQSKPMTKRRLVRQARGQKENRSLPCPKQAVLSIDLAKSILAFDHILLLIVRELSLSTLLLSLLSLLLTTHSLHPSLRRARLLVVSHALIESPREE